MIAINNYIDYFRQLAVSHKDLQHNPLSEDGDAPDNSKHFCRWSMEEVLTGLRTTVGFPCLLLELYEVNTNAEAVYDVKCNFKGAFTVVDHATPQKFSEEIAAYQNSERIAKELLQQIWQHHYGPETNRCETPFGYFNFDGIDIMPVGPVITGAEFGYRVEFGFKPKDGYNLSTPPTAGTFI